MKPTVEEQLTGTCKILEDVVAPQVNNPYAAEVLRGLVANLRMLGAAVSNLDKFVKWDNDATEGVLRTVGMPVATGQLRTDLESGLSAPVADTLDWTAMAERNEVLRGLLTRVIREADLAPAAERQLMTHLTERAARSPIRYATAMPMAGE